MRQSLRTFTILGFVLAFAVLGVVGTVSYRNTRRLLDDAALVERTQDVLSTLTALLSELNEAESNQRGYLITADSQYYLRRFRGAVMGTRAQLGQLRGLVAGNDYQTQQVERLQGLIDQRILQLEDRVRLREQEGLDRVAQDLESRPADRQVQDVARLFAEHERRTLEQRSESARISGQETQLTILLGSIIALLLVGLALMIVDRERRERVAAHTALAAQEQQLMQFMNGLPMGVLVLDRNRRVKYVNQAARDLFGAHAIPGVDYRKIFSIFQPGTEEHYPEDRLPLIQALRGETSTMSDLEVRVRDRILEVSVSAAPIHDAEGNIIYSIAAFTNISARRAVDRMKDEFLSMVSHELRTPLTSIRGALGLLTTGKLGELAPKGLRMVEIATADTDRLVRLINDILDIERMESGRVTLDRTQVDGAELVQRAVDAITPLAERAGVSLTSATQPVIVWADPDRIVQTLINLIGNAIKFTPSGAGVQVKLEVAGPEAVFSVHDEGRGIPGDKLQTIFERFQQVDASDARQKGGAGLGLAISRSIVVQHGGHIWAESDGQFGSTFRFTVPVLQADDGVTQPGVKTSTVLVGETSAPARALLQSVLEEGGHGVITATTGNQVLELARTSSPSAILLDLLSPEMDGWETARRLRADEELRNTPVVVMSALSPRSGTSSLSGWLRQPLEPAVLIDSLSHWLSSNGSIQRVLFVTPDVALGDELRDRSEAKSLSPTVTANLGDALRVLETMTPDAIVLDFMLLDRSGHELIDQLRTKTQTRSIPLVMYAASEFDASVAHAGSAHKTRAHTEEVAQRIALLLQRMTAPR